MKILKLVFLTVSAAIVLMTGCGGNSSETSPAEPKATDLSCDINGDGYPDLALGAYFYGYYDADPMYNEGRVYVFYSGPAGLGSAPSLTIESPLPDTIEGFGKFIIMNDFNGDGYSDMAVGNENLSGNYNGHVFIFYGSSSGLSGTPDTTLTGNTDSRFGWSLCSGDFNGDGYYDLAAGAYYGSGALYVFYGSSAKIADCDLSSTGTADVTISGSASSNLGSSVIAGDFNGDGYDDLAAAAAGANTVSIFNGSSAGLSTTASVTLTSIEISDLSGGSLAAGNVNGDAYTDLATGADEYNTGTGRAYVFHGSSSGISAVPDCTLTGEYTADHYGYSLSLADTDMDGYDDLAVGAYSYRNNEINQYYGAIYLYNGSSAGLSATESSHLYGAASSDYLGTIVHFSDINSDGHIDLFGLAKGYEYSADFFGRAYLYYGTASGISFANPWYYDFEYYIP